MDDQTRIMQLQEQIVGMANSYMTIIKAKNKQIDDLLTALKVLAERYKK